MQQPAVDPHPQASRIRDLQRQCNPAVRRTVGASKLRRDFQLLGPLHLIRCELILGYTRRLQDLRQGLMPAFLS
jgi:hypothetical protein